MHNGTKLSAAKIANIRKAHEEGMSYSKLAKKYGVSRNTIINYVNADPKKAEARKELDKIVEEQKQEDILKNRVQELMEENKNLAVRLAQQAEELVKAYAEDDSKDPVYMVAATTSLTLDVQNNTTIWGETMLEGIYRTKEQAKEAIIDCDEVEETEDIYPLAVIVELPIGTPLDEEPKVSQLKQVFIAKDGRYVPHDHLSRHLKAI